MGQITRTDEVIGLIGDVLSILSTVYLIVGIRFLHLLDYISYMSVYVVHLFIQLARWRCSSKNTTSI